MSSDSDHRTRATIIVIAAVIQLIIVVASPRTLLGFVISVIPLWFAAIALKMGECNSIINYIASGAVLLAIIITPGPSVGNLLLLYFILGVQLFTVMCGMDKKCSKNSTYRRTCANYKPCRMCKRKY